MRFLLDTNIISAYLKGDQRVFNRFIQHTGGLSTSTICAGELYSWVRRKKTRAAHRVALDEVLGALPLLPVDHDVARKYGEVRAALLDQGRPTPEIDLLIGCTALVHDLTVVTHNVVDFAQISALRVEDWLT
jgi:tRNA(fMet)-specific endonuclease VapC